MWINNAFASNECEIDANYNAKALPLVEFANDREDSDTLCVFVTVLKMPDYGLPGIYPRERHCASNGYGWQPF